MARTSTFIAGPWSGTENTVLPYDDTPSLLTDALNCYLPDPKHTSECNARPGAILAAAMVGVSIGNEVFSMIDSTGTVRNFVVVNDNKIYRLDNGIFYVGNLLWTDVTPTGIAIGGNVFLQAINGQLVVNDENHRPWVGTNLGNTPITGTYIVYDAPQLRLSRGTIDTRVHNSAYTQTAGSSTQTVAAGDISIVAQGGGGTIPANTWGVYLVQRGSGAFLITPGAANFTTGYATEALAIAALPALTLLTYWYVGYFTVQTKVGSPFVGGTDALAGGATGNVANATNYYAGESNAWTAVGRPTIYVGSLFFVLRTINGVDASTQIAWSEPNQPLVGYSQPNYADWWVLLQTGNSPLYVLIGTNAGLFYSRAFSWGVLTGVPSINFQNSATHDVVSYNIGCVASRTCQLFGRYLYFCDAIGRPWRMVLGGAPEAIWQQLRSIVDTVTASGAGSPPTSPFTIQSYAWAVIEPNLNKYIVFPWINQSLPPQVGHVFDAVSGIYEGRWTMGTTYSTVATSPMDVGGIVQDNNNNSYLLIFGSQGTTTGYQWILQVPSANIWQDNNVNPMPIIAQTQRLGYSTATEWTLNTIRAVTNNATPITATTLATNGNVSQGTQTPPASSDGTNLALWQTGPGTTGRGFQVSLSPTTSTSQWKLFRVEVDCVPSNVVAGDA